MSTESIEKLKQALDANPELRDKLKALPANQIEHAESIASLAAEAGYPMTAEEILAISSQGELSEEQLEHVAGGRGGLGDLIISAISPAACESNRPPKL